MITGTTKLTGLLGSPVAHSLSPKMHNTAFRSLRLDYVYLCFDVKEAQLADAVNGLKACGVRGFNLTMPLKNRMMDLLDDCTPAASLIRAVNTVVNEDGRLIGYNTDGSGFLQSLEESGTSVKGRRMVLLGAGGAASAIAVQTALEGAAQLDLFLRMSSRFLSGSAALADELNRKTDCRVRMLDLEDEALLEERIRDADILVNATPVGMEPDTDRCLIRDAGMLSPSLTVADIIYHPRTTKLLAVAKEAGCRICPGTGMLLHQGAEAFRLWTGKEMPLDQIRDVVGLAPEQGLL